MAIDRCDLNKTGGHILAIVGYNDDIWIDINYDGEVQEAELGALKIVNSWGAGWGNNGFAWVAYDALNKTSQILTTEEATRINNEIDAGTIKANKVNNSVRKSFFMFGIWSYPVIREKITSDCRLYMTVNTGSRKEMDMSITATNKEDGTKTSYTLPKLSVETDNLAWDGTAKSTDGTMVLDLDNVIPDISGDTMEDYIWEVTFGDDTADVYSLTVKDLYFTVNGSKKYTTSLSKIPLNGTEKTYTMSLRTAESTEDPAITEENKKNVVIYYSNSSFDDANIHYKVGNGTWTTAPGVQMCVDSEQSGYTWKYVINLGNETSLTACFNEDNTSWDSNNGNNYTLKAGCYGIKNGVITELEEVVITPDPIIELDKKSTSLYVGDSATITATVTDGSVSDIVWSSSDENVATVSSTGEVLAVGEGSATITASIKDISESCQVTVQKKAVTDKPKITETPTITETPKPTETPTITEILKPTETPKALTIELDKSSLNIYKGTVEELVATIKEGSEEETETTVTWTSGNEKVAIVSNTGKVVAVGAGTTTITAGIDGVSAVCQVTVQEKTVTDKPETPQATAIELDKTSLNLYEGAMEELAATIKGETTGTVNWTSGNEKVAIVSNTGKIVAVGAGTTTITVNIDEVSAVCQVTVQGKTDTDQPEITKLPQATAIELDKTVLNISIGAEEKLAATVKGETTGTINWTSANEEIAVVSNSGKVVGIGAGTTTITASIDGVSAVCQITVQEKTVTDKPQITEILQAIAIELNKTSLNIYEGSVEELVATIKGETTGTVSWTSANEEIAVVSTTGKVVCVGAGITTITASIDGVSKSCQVTVQEKTVTDNPITDKPVTDKPELPQTTVIELDKTSLNMYTKEVENLTVTIKGETTDTIIWKSDNEEIAVVSNTGKVVAVGVGTTIITATVDGVSVSCTVKVSDSKMSLNKQKYTLYTAGRKKVTLKIKMNGKELSGKSVSWYSSNPGIAKVSSNGVVTAKKKGKVTITAVDTTRLKAKCVITVKKPAITVKTKSVVTLKKGKTLKISAKSTPGGKFTYKTSSKKIATVNTKGVIKAKKKGTAYITISRNGVKKKIKVIVK